MKFVCKFSDYKHEIQAGTVSYMQGEGNQAVAVQTSPHLVAEFASGVLSAAEREACRQKFDGPSTSLYAREQPGAPRYDGVFGIGSEGSITGDATNMIFHGSRAEFLYSVFDTENMDQCPPEYREIFEAVLSADREACARLSDGRFLGKWALHPTTDLRSGDLINLGALMATVESVETLEGVVVSEVVAGPRWEQNFPWPTYDDLTGVNVAKQIDETCDLIGADKERVAHYEVEHKNRPSVIGLLLGVKVTEAKTIAKNWLEAVAAEQAAFEAAAAARAALAPKKMIGLDEVAPNQLDGQMPPEALTDEIRFGDFVQPMA